MDDIGVAIISLSFLVVVLTTILFNRQRRRKSKLSSNNPWGGPGRRTNFQEYIYLDD